MNRISIYSYPDNKQLYRIGIKPQKYKISSAQKFLGELDDRKRKGKLNDANEKTLAEASYNVLSKNVKCTTGEKLQFTYKINAKNSAGLLWLLKEIPVEIGAIIIHELLIK